MREPIALIVVGLFAFPLSQMWGADGLFWLNREVLGVLGHSASLILWCVLLIALAATSAVLALVKGAATIPQGRFTLTFSLLVTLGVFLIGRRAGWGMYGGAMHSLSVAEFAGFAASWIVTFSFLVFVVCSALKRLVPNNALQATRDDARA